MQLYYTGGVYTTILYRGCTYNYIIQGVYIQLYYIGGVHTTILHINLTGTIFDEDSWWETISSPKCNLTSSLRKFRYLSS